MDSNDYNLLSPENFAINPRLHSIVESLVTVYSKILIDREAKGIDYKGMSRREYDKFRTDDEITSRKIENSLGSWSNIKKILPIGDDAGGRMPGRQYTASHVVSIIRDVAKEYGVNPADLAIWQFEEFRKNHKEKNIASWERYAVNLNYGRKWSDMIRGVLEEDYKRRNLKKVR